LLGQYEEALAHYNVAEYKFPSNGLIFYNRGLTKASLGGLSNASKKDSDENFELARKDFVNAMDKLSSPNEMYRNRFNLGITLRRLGRLDESIDELRKACDL